MMREAGVFFTHRNNEKLVPICEHFLIFLCCKFRFFGVYFCLSLVFCVFCLFAYVLFDLFVLSIVFWYQAKRLAGNVS